MNNEGALIAFTLLSQAIIGATVVYALAYFINVEGVTQLSSGFSLRTPEFLLLLGMLLAILISFLHLGRPANATNALNNLKTSWISREIFTVTLFSLCLLGLFLARWLGAGKPLLAICFAGSGIAALLLLISMVKLYMIPAVSTWNSWLTPANFTLAALISGITLALLYASVLQVDTVRLKPIATALIILLLLEVIHTGYMFGQLNSMDLSHSNLFIAEGTFRPFLIIRMAMAGIALLLLLFIILQGIAGSPGLLLWLSLSLIIGELLIGRFVFFASYVRIGI